MTTLSERRCTFDAQDVELLLTMADGERTVLRFTPAELRQQIRAAEVNAAVCRTYGEDAQANVFDDLARAMRTSLDILLSRMPRPGSRKRPGQETVDVQDLKAHSDIVAVAGRYTQLRKSGSRFVGKCFLHDDRHPSFVVYPENSSFFCFSCNRGGDAIDLIMAAEHIDFQGALGVLAR